MVMIKIQAKPIPPAVRRITLLLVLLTPVLTNLVAHTGSGILLFLVLLGIYGFFRQGAAAVDADEKAVMGVFAAWFLICCCMAVGHNIADGTPAFHVDVGHDVRMLAFFPIYDLLRRVPPPKLLIWSGIIIGAAAAGLYALAAAVATGFSERIIGPYNPCLFGYFSVALAFMSLSGVYFFYQKNPKLAVLPFLGFAGGLLAAFLSGTRGSVITIPALSVIFLLQVRGHLKKINAPMVLGGAAAVLVLLALIFPHLNLAERFQKGIAEARYFLENRDCVACIAPHEAHHLRMWLEAADIIQDAPVFGVGPGNYRKIVTRRVETGRIAPGIEIFDEPHNFYLNMWATYGLPGLGLLLAFFTIPLVVLIRTLRVPGTAPSTTDRDMSWCGITLVAGYMLFSLTNTLFNRNMLITFYLVMLAAILCAVRPATRPANRLPAAPEDPLIP